LKTPLSAIAALSRRARDAGASDAADGIDRAIASIITTIDAELARARIAAAGRRPGAPTPVRPIVERLVTVLEHTGRGGQLAFAIDVPASLELPAEPEDLSELLGAILENAVKYARRQVRIAGRADPDWTIVTIEDDGPGIASDRIADALTRGGRLDESVAGTGLGLAIARELVEAMEGSIELGESDLGGLSVQFAWRALATTAVTQSPWVDRTNGLTGAS
jgi:signal transduction histidine kinase